MAYNDLVSFADVRVLEGDRRALRVAVNGREVWVPYEHMAIADGVVGKAGDRGRLILPRWVAIGLGLIDILHVPVEARSRRPAIRASARPRARRSAER